VADRQSTLLVFDGNNILMRALKASEARVPLTSEEGTWTAPVFLFINMMSKYVKRYSAQHVVVAWDKGHDFRDMIYPDYKGGRAKHDYAHDDPQTGVFGMAKTFLTLAGIHHLEVPGYEADDIIGAYWRKPWLHMRIVSGDKDLLQLVGDRVVQVRPGGPQTSQGDEEWDSNRVYEKFGCTPAQLPLVMALTGDTGDDVPGIRGYGPKFACKHLAEVNWNLATLLDHPPERLKKVAGFREIVERNLKLVNLRHLPLTVEDPPPFDPTWIGSAAWHDLEEWCDMYQMATVKTRLLEGTLWKEK
jgi:5'-3' exonuclease